MRGFEKSAGTGGRPTARSSRGPMTVGAPSNDCGPCDIGCPTGARPAPTSVLAEGLEPGRHAQDGSARARDHRHAGWTAEGVLYHDAHGELREQKARIVVLACNGVGTPRPAPQLALRAVSRRPGQPIGPGRQEPHVPSVRERPRHLSRAAGGIQGSDRLHDHQPGVLRDRSCTRLRSWLFVPGRPGLEPGRLGGRRTRQSAPSVGRGSPEPVRRAMGSRHRASR